MSKYDVKSRMP